MKKYIVTEESLERAIRCLSEPIEMNGSEIWQAIGLIKQTMAALFVPENEEAKQKPKPFGPGTRLRAVNGDELKVIQYFGDWGIINVRTNEFGSPGYAEGWWTPENLERLLKSSGATVIEDEDNPNIVLCKHSGEEFPGALTWKCGICGGNRIIDKLL